MTKSEIGRLGESAACEFLIKSRHTILERNYHSRYGEIDIIASDGRYLLLVEVKTRQKNSLASPASAVDRRKQRKLCITAQDYLSKYPSELQPRFDVVEVITSVNGAFGDMEIHHIKNAFWMEDSHGLF